MLNNISNFFNLFKTKKIKKTLAPNDIIPIGVRDTTNRADYQASGITYKDFAAQVGGLQTVSVDGITIFGNGTPGSPLYTSPVNLYNSNGTITSTNRNVNGNGNNTLTFQSFGVVNVYNPFYNEFNNPAAGRATKFSTSDNSITQSIIQNDERSDITISKDEINISSRQSNVSGIFTRIADSGIFGMSSNLNDFINSIYKGISINFPNRIYKFGQINGGNNTTFTIADGAQVAIQIDGTGITQNTAGVASGVNLKIKVNGVDYVIELKQPA